MADKGMQVTRRSMLQMSGGTFAVAGVAAISGPWPSLFNRFRLQDVDAETFRPYIGRTFVFKRPLEDQVLSLPFIELKLAKVTLHENISRIESGNPAILGKRRRASFSLLFEQKGSKPLGEGLQRLAHADFEDFQLFLSQVGVPLRDGTIYLEAIFG